MLPTALPAPFSATLSPALSVYLPASVRPQGLPVVRLPAPFVPHSASLGPATARRVLSTPVPVSAPPTGLDEGLFFYFLGVGPPCRSILCQFWLCKEAQCVYLCHHLGSLICISFKIISAFVVIIALPLLTLGFIWFYFCSFLRWIFKSCILSPLAFLIYI